MVQFSAQGHSKNALEQRMVSASSAVLRLRFRLVCFGE